MAKNMANKYLRLMPVFHRQGLTNFGDLLNTQPPTVTRSNLKRLSDRVDQLQRRSNTSMEIRRQLEAAISGYISGSSKLAGGEDVRLAMLLILINRYIKRVPQSGLFDLEEAVEPNRPIRADSGVADGARIFLLHEYGRPYFYGIDALSDASSENAELFLNLAGELVKVSQARIIRDEEAQLSAKYQHQLLTKKSAEIIRDWTFPGHQDVRKLCNIIAAQCIEKSLEPNASLGGGANAFGIPDEDFAQIASKHPELARVIKFGVAYSALTIKRHHWTKHREWTLVELTGPTLVLKGLTFTRGGFLERTVPDLLSALEGD